MATISYDVEDAFAYVILRTHRLLRWHFQRSMRSQGLPLTQEQFVLLNKLAHRNGCTQGELVNATFNDRANISRIVVGLEEKGFVERVDDAHDGRSVRVFLTRWGRAVLHTIGEQVPRSRARIYAGLDADDLAELKRICGILEANVLESLSAASDTERQRARA